MAGDRLGPETRETARRLDEITDRLGKLQAQLDERQPLYDGQATADVGQPHDGAEDGADGAGHG